MAKLRRTKCPRCKKDVAVRRGGEIREHRGNYLDLCMASGTEAPISSPPVKTRWVEVTFRIQVAAKTFSSERDHQAWLDSIDDKYTEILDSYKPNFVLDSSSCEVNPCDD